MSTTPLDQAFIEAMANDCAARHHTPKSTVIHPSGVIVPGDPHMTDKIKEPDYVPYCGPCNPMQRLRRTAYGFACPSCGQKSNYDLTPYNGNLAVQYEGQPLSIAAWNAEVERKKASRRLSGYPC
jgi:hypothetical protein